MTKKIFLDIECYPNYFLICFKSQDKTRFFELYEGSEPLDVNIIKKIMSTYLTIGFNSNSYDLPMLVYALRGNSNKKLKELSDTLINSNVSKRKIFDNYHLNVPSTWNHIDLIEPAPAVKVSLKMYGARMHTKNLQDLPFEPDTIIEKKDHSIIRQYCANDTIITMELYNQIEERIILREKISNDYRIDLRSKSDAQIAETIIRKILHIGYYEPNVNTNTIYKYIPPAFIKFQTADLLSFFDKLQLLEFKCSENGSIIKDTLFKDSIVIKDTPFTVGIGGLHSNEKHIATISNSDEFLINVDVTSYYPTIILNNKYYPERIGSSFLKIYGFFYKERLKAKENKDKIKADIYKIILNGSFGKFGSKYSCLYSPSLLLHTTITGQLALLLLIENLLLADFEIISANTDGITIKGKNQNKDKFDKIIQEWEILSKFTLEHTYYKAVYHESVNSYVAITKEDKVYCKGNYTTDSLTKNPCLQICIDAIIAYLITGKDIKTFILENKNNITKFLVTRKVTGGAMYKEKYIGKVIRWYYGLDKDVIVYKKNGNKVANSEGAIPLMNLPDEAILDINFDKYIAKTYKMLGNLGINQYKEQIS